MDADVRRAVESVVARGRVHGLGRSCDLVVALLELEEIPDPAARRRRRWLARHWLATRHPPAARPGDGEDTGPNDPPESRHSSADWGPRGTFDETPPGPTGPPHLRVNGGPAGDPAARGSRRSTVPARPPPRRGRGRNDWARCSASPVWPRPRPSRWPPCTPAGWTGGPECPPSTRDATRTTGRRTSRGSTDWPEGVPTATAGRHRRGRAWHERAPG